MGGPGGSDRRDPTRGDDRATGETPFDRVDGVAADDGVIDEGSDETTEPPLDPAEGLELFAPGDLASARIVPATIVLRPGRERRVRADALDDDGRAIRRPLSYTWTLDGAAIEGAIEIRGEGARTALVPSPSARSGVVAGSLRVRIEEGRDRVEATAAIVIDDSDDDGAFDHGIPEPLFESDVRGAWRSRFEGSRWVVNDAHEDWVALRGDARTRLRYVLSLFAKDVVLRSYALPGSAEVLERLVEILAHAERNLRGGG